MAKEGSAACSKDGLNSWRCRRTTAWVSSSTKARRVWQGGNLNTLHWKAGAATPTKQSRGVATFHNWVSRVVVAPELNMWAKAKRIRRTLTDQVSRDTKQAQEPSLKAIVCLEIAGERAETEAVGFVYDSHSWMVGISTRWDDSQHTGEATFEEYPDRYCFKAWQTKVTDGTASATQILPLTCPKRCFARGYTQEPWYERHQRRLKALRADPKLAGRDYLVPALAHGRAHFLPKPMKKGQSLKLLREALHIGGLPLEEAKLYTLPSLRAFMPSLASHHGVSKDRRSALGRWAAESSVDVYRRQLGDTVVSIWDAVLNGIATQGDMYLQPNFQQGHPFSVRAARDFADREQPLRRQLGQWFFQAPG